MKKLIVALILSNLILAGCSSVSENRQIRESHYNLAKINAIDYEARRKGVTVYWFNLPTVKKSDKQ